MGTGNRSGGHKVRKNCQVDVYPSGRALVPVTTAKSLCPVRRIDSEHGNAVHPVVNRRCVRSDDRGIKTSPAQCISQLVLRRNVAGPKEHNFFGGHRNRATRDQMVGYACEQAQSADK